jgi:penicillin-binding protein 2
MFGLGARLGVDLPSEDKGNIPDTSVYNKEYRGSWNSCTNLTLGIGQDKMTATPLQLANSMCLIANRGYYYEPHLIKSIGKSGKPLPQYLVKHYTTIDSSNFRIAVDAMQEVVNSGTGQYRASLKDVIVCGKTGSVQNEPRPDHSVFIAFAPKDNPKIAVSVYVEFSGQGARAAASIASLMIEKYLYGGTKRPHIEEYVLRGKFLD